MVVFLTYQRHFFVSPQKMFGFEFKSFAFEFKAYVLMNKKVTFIDVIVNV